MGLTEAQTRDIIYTERVGSVLSLCGATFVIVTFILDNKFRKPINRLVFFATFGNILTNVATMVSTAGIEAGLNSPLCQFQAFLIQWFMPADALWTFAMACNVYLTFFHAYDTAQLRKLEPKYILGCYGLPFLTSFAFFFVRTAKRGKVYGGAVLWCWISMDWDFLRVATFYGPVWLVIIATIAIYVKVGTVVFKWRKHLLALGREIETATTTSEVAPTSTQILKTYEVIITSSGQGPETPQNLGFTRDRNSRFDDKTSWNRRTGPLNNRGSDRPHASGIDPNKAALKYGKCALLFFIALLITWVPSTINRIYTLFRPNAVIFGLNYAASLVLPLQGLWNAVVYTATSTYAVKSLPRDIASRFRKPKSNGISVQMRRQGQPLGSEDAAGASVHIAHSTVNVQDPAASQSELIGHAV